MHGKFELEIRHPTAFRQAKPTVLYWTLNRIFAAPTWSRQLYPDLAKGDNIDPGHKLSFLENLLTDAQPFWATGQLGHLGSGIGHEDTPSGEKLRLKAKAVNGGGAQFLLIEGTEGDRHRGLLQKAGESELKHLTRWAAKGTRRGIAAAYRCDSRTPG